MTICVRLITPSLLGISETCAFKTAEIASTCGLVAGLREEAGNAVARRILDEARLVSPSEAERFRRSGRLSPFG